MTNSAGVELLPCPFCGSKPSLRRRQDEDLATHNVVEWVTISCPDCGSAHCEWPVTVEPSAIERWNKRALPAPSAPHSQASEVVERDAKDFAIEFGGYLADSAEGLLAYLSTPGLADADAAADLVSGLRSAIYEFKKRRDKAAALSRQAPQPQAEFIRAAHRDNKMEDATTARDILDLKIQRSETGLWNVTGSAGKNLIFMAHRDLGAIVDDLPNVLRHVLKQHLGMKAA